MATLRIAMSSNEHSHGRTEQDERRSGGKAVGARGVAEFWGRGSSRSTEFGSPRGSNWLERVGQTTNAIVIYYCATQGRPSLSPRGVGRGKSLRVAARTLNTARNRAWRTGRSVRACRG